MNTILIPLYGINISFIKHSKTNGIFKDLYNMNAEEIYLKMEQHMKNTEEGTMQIFSLEEIQNFINTATKECINALQELK